MLAEPGRVKKKLFCKVALGKKAEYKCHLHLAATTCASPLKNGVIFERLRERFDCNVSELLGKGDKEFGWNCISFSASGRDTSISRPELFRFRSPSSCIVSSK